MHRLIDRLGLRRQQLFAAQADVVERLRALARLGELASAFVRRSPQATPREFARSIAAVADYGLREQEEPELSASRDVQVVALEAVGSLEAEHVYLVGLHAGLAAPEPEAIPDALLVEPVPPDTEEGRRRALAQMLYVACTRARGRLVFAYPSETDRGAVLLPLPLVERSREALGADWEDRQEELFGPAETLHSTYRMLRDELLESTLRVGGRLSELRFDTDLDVSHAVVRYLELLKLAALIARPEGQSVAEALRDVNTRILQAVTAEQREIFTSSMLDEYLLDAERDARRRTQALAARDEPSLEPFLPKRGDGVVLSASDIDTYRTCPLKYKFARVFRIPQEPTIHQRFGILVHQVLERFHALEGSGGTLAELLGLLDAGWRRGGFGDSEQERQLRGKAAASLTRYHARFQSQESDADVVRALVHVQARPAPAARAGRPRRPAARRRVRADRLQDRAAEERRPAGRGRAAVAVRGGRAGGVEPGGVAAGLLLRARRREGERRLGGRGPVGVDPRGGHRGRRGDPLAGVRADAVVCRVLDVRLPAGVPGG